VFGGVSAASVLGVPAGTLLADVAGWRAAFAGAGALGAAAVVLLLVLVPPLPSRRAGDWRDAPRLLRGTPAVRAGAAITFLLVTAHFTAYTFVRPLLERVAEVDGRWIGPLLLAYGAAGMAGNFAAGAALTRDVPRTVLAIAVALAAVPPLFALAGTAPASGAVLVVLWGLAYGGVSVSLQTWMLRAAPDDAEAASSLLVMAFNLAIALGALAGGRVADAFPLTGVLWTAGLLALPAALVVLTTKRK
ncbi:MFS transporter, partial [Actinomadura kijaniata]|uniref:MFS transporter n=1 Tax=Actinomadura kijaniata TaxID=46161 RepID=UPI000A7F2694